MGNCEARCNDIIFAGVNLMVLSLSVNKNVIIWNAVNGGVCKLNNVDVNLFFRSLVKPMHFSARL